MGGDTVKKLPILKILPLVQIVLVAACGTDSPQRVLAPSGELKATSQRYDDDTYSARARFSAWSSPSNIGPPVNTPFAEQGPAISKDGLSLYFQCLSCPGGYGNVDIWVSERASIDDPWGPPQNLGPAINTAANDGSPALSSDGRRLFFDSDRTGGVGGFDIYVARRRHKRDNLGWQTAVNLGSGVNTTANEQGAEYLRSDENQAAGDFEDDANETATLYFASDRVGGPGLSDIYAIALNSDDTFGVPMLAEGINTQARESGPGIRRDGLELFFVSDRAGGFGGVDLWVATRASTSDPWSTPANMGQPINSEKNEGGPALSFDGTSLYFHSPRTGNVGGAFFDVLLATRERLKGHDRD
jgi:Tol biopolymer transport system component